MAEQIVVDAAKAEAHIDEVATLELQLLLEAVYRYAGYDYREYSQTVLKRRVSDRMRAEGAATISALQDRLLHDRGALERFILAMSARSQKLFSTPDFFDAFRRLVVPMLRTYSFVRIWFLEAGTGEDVYSLATILLEQDLFDRCMLYATTASSLALAHAREGRYQLFASEEISRMHRESGALKALSEYSEIDSHEIRFHDAIREKIIFANHNIVSDASLNEFHVIVARSVLSAFNKSLQFRVHGLILQSLSRFGFLCLGQGESLKSTPYERAFRQVDLEQPIYRRMR